MVLPPIHYDEIVHNNEDLMVARIVCMEQIIVVQQYVGTCDSIYYVFYRTDYALLEFYNHFVTNDLHYFHTLRQIFHEIY